MSPKIHQRETSPRTAAAPARVLKPPRAFTDPAARPETTQAPDPDFETRLDRAARYGHSLARIAARTERPSPPGNGPVIQRMEDGEFSEWKKANLASEKAKIKKEYPHLANVPDEWIEPGAHNPGGPPIRLNPPLHSGPSDETIAQVKDHPDALIVDLDRDLIQPPKTQPLPLNRYGPEWENKTRSDARNYAMLTNAYLSSLPQAPIAQQTEGSLGGEATKTARKERNRNRGKYEESLGGKNVVGHVPDSSVSGLPYSPMGFMSMTTDANYIAGYQTGIGLKARDKSKIGSILVREKGGQLHRYTLPPGINPTSNTPTSTPLDTASPPKIIQEEFEF